MLWTDCVQFLVLRDQVSTNFDTPNALRNEKRRRLNATLDLDDLNLFPVSLFWNFAIHLAFWQFWSLFALKMFSLGAALGGFFAGLNPISWIVVGVGVTVVVVAAVVAYRRGHKAGRNKGREESEEQLSQVS